MASEAMTPRDPGTPKTPETLSLDHRQEILTRVVLLFVSSLRPRFHEKFRRASYSNALDVGTAEAAMRRVAQDFVDALQYSPKTRDDANTLMYKFCGAIQATLSPERFEGLIDFALALYNEALATEKRRVIEAKNNPVQAALTECRSKFEAMRTAYDPLRVLEEVFPRREED